MDEVNLRKYFGELLMDPSVKWNERLHCRAQDYEELKRIGKDVKCLYYPGCGRDFTPIYAVDADVFIYQDPGDFGFGELSMGSSEKVQRPIQNEYVWLFYNLQERGLMRNVKVERHDKFEIREFIFESKNLETGGFSKKKSLTLFYGEYGLMEAAIPTAIATADLTYLHGLNLKLCVLPYLKEGSLIRSATTIDSPWYLDIPKDTDVGQFGLEVLEMEDEKDRILLKKIRHVDIEGVETLMRTVWEKYLKENKNSLQDWEIRRAKCILES